MSTLIDDQLIGMWYVGFRHYNWSGVLRRSEEGGFVLTYQTRVYLDDKTFDSKDEREIVHLRSLNPSEEVALRCVRNLFNKAREQEGVTVSWELLKGDMSLEQFMQALIKQPGINYRVNEVPEMRH